MISAAPHYRKEVRNYLNTIFPNRWISEEERLSGHQIYRHSITFFWDHLKSRVYKTKSRNVENLRHRILEESALIEPDFIRNAVTSLMI